MTTDSPAPPSPATDRADSRRPRLRALAAAALVLALLAALAVGYRWWSHPDLLEDRGDAMGMAPAPVAQAARAAAVPFPDVDAEDPTTITFRGASAVLDRDSARAEVSFFLCTWIQAEGVIGYVGGDLSTYCSDVRPITEGTELSYPSPSEYVVVLVTPTRPGTTHLTRVDLDYSLDASHLFRRGTDSIRMDLKIRAT